MKKRLSLTILTVLASSALSAQTLPQLACKRMESNICTNPGSGGQTTQPTLIPLKAYGSATWTYTPPNDGINHVAYSYDIPNLSTFINGSDCGKATRDVAVIVSNADLYSSITQNSAIPANSIVSSSTLSYSTSNPISKALSTAVETAAQANTYWTIIVREGDFSLASTVQGKGWARNASVCRLYVSQPSIYVPPTKVQ